MKRMKKMNMTISVVMNIAEELAIVNIIQDTSNTTYYHITVAAAFICIAHFNNYSGLHKKAN